MISHEWTQKERLQIISNIADKLMSIGLSRHDSNICEYAERILYTAIQPPAFLEANRDKIINGTPTTTPSTNQENRR